MANVLNEKENRGNWEISRRDMNSPRIVAMVSTDRNFLDPDFDDFSASNSGGLTCCRSVAITVKFLSLSFWNEDGKTVKKRNE